MNTQNLVTRDISRVEFIALIAALMALNSLAIDVMLPALPYMAEALAIVNENDRQLVLVSYMLGFGVTQIFFGPLSDRFGRRTPLIAGLVVYCVAAFVAVFAPNFGTLLFLRVVQGMGAAGTRVIAQSIVRDRFAGRAMAEVMSMVFMVFMIVPIIAPGIGQVLLLTGPWWTIFLFMAGLALVVTVWTMLRLPETLDIKDRRPLTISVISEGFVIVFRSKVALLYAVAGVFTFGALIGFIYTAQQIYVGIYDLGPYFPVAFAGVACLMALSSYLNSRVVGRFGMRRISHFSLLVFIITSGIWWAISLTGTLPLPLFLFLFSIIMFYFGWIASNMNALSMEPLGHVAGTASSVFGFLQTVGGALIGMSIGRMFDGTIVPIAGGYFFVGFLALVCVLIAENGKLFGVGADYKSEENAPAE